MGLGVEVKRLTSLCFGNVVLESSLLGSEARIYDADGRSFCMRPSEYIVTKVPLDELRETLPEDKVRMVSERLLSVVRLELDTSYPGGYERAVDELTRWLSSRE